MTTFTEVHYKDHNRGEWVTAPSVTVTVSTDGVTLTILNDDESWNEVTLELDYLLEKASLS